VKSLRHHCRDHFYPATSIYPTVNHGYLSRELLTPLGAYSTLRGHVAGRLCPRLRTKACGSTATLDLQPAFTFRPRLHTHRRSSNPSTPLSSSLSCGDTVNLNNSYLHPSHKYLPTTKPLPLILNTHHPAVHLPPSADPPSIMVSISTFSTDTPSSFFLPQQNNWPRQRVMSAQLREPSFGKS
jgi:hypothetical protein